MQERIIEDDCGYLMMRRTGSHVTATYQGGGRGAVGLAFPQRCDDGRAVRTESLREILDDESLARHLTQLQVVTRWLQQIAHPALIT